MRRMPVRDGELLTLAVGIGFGEHDFVAFGNFDKRLPLGVAGSDEQALDLRSASHAASFRLRRFRSWAERM